MPRVSSISVKFLAYCLLIGFTQALIGRKVYSVRFNQYPFVVSISQKITNRSHSYTSHVCTGSIIRPKSVLTAAHCLTNKQLHDIHIIAGSVNLKQGQNYYPESWITFDQWNKNPNWKYHMNDIAVIILQGEGVTDVAPGIVPLIFHSILNEHTKLRIAGWGESEKGNKIEHLRGAQLPIISNQECGEKGTKLKGKHFSVPPNYFCSKADPWVLSSCGDGGAPVFTLDYQIMGINIGLCPNLEGHSYSTEFLYQNQLNSHLHISYYKNFIEHVWK